MPEERVKKILSLLEKAYPHAALVLHYKNPLELLVATILAAQCTDERVNKVTETLFKKYKSAKDYASTEPDVFEQEIRSTGFYRNKARNIIACGEELVERFGGKVPDTMEDLVTLSGVGRKTASVLLGNVFGKPAMAVDTHVFRVSHRLEFAKANDPDKVEQELCKIIPQDKWMRSCLVMGTHGRRTCIARKPICNACVIEKLCNSPDKTYHSK
ncbi:MAG: endonuclease III [Candidatus Brocadia sp.]|nr:endonuclease III [Candidatus Brocadia sp.]MCE7912920.1 endonuclease III [Candidatus Brocadia sp. AMX3]OQZ01861.1 MAG: endonuclease III [Candidatus Brocadia sp. UTAMX2]MDG5998170.1 endonuclease III [Candidatus Brocadia sp.]RIJ90993.1 MAG: endonuclease III [Candidatus Brocadia sp.]